MGAAAGAAWGAADRRHWFVRGPFQAPARHWRCLSARNRAEQVQLEAPSGIQDSGASRTGPAGAPKQGRQRVAQRASGDVAAARRIGRRAHTTRLSRLLCRATCGMLWSTSCASAGRPCASAGRATALLTNQPRPQPQQGLFRPLGLGPVTRRAFSSEAPKSECLCML